jgi:RHS repeat-associated protein
MAYNSVGGITTKTQNHSSSIYTSPDTDYDYDYSYNTGQPHTLNTVTNGSNSMEFTYDANGNMTEVDNKVGSTVVSTETLFWNESNQLQADHNLGGLHHFMYDANGERYLKGTLLFDEVDVDGTPINGTDVTTSDYTVYVNPYLVYNSKFENQYGYSKHYYIGSERVASAIGNGSVNSNSNPVVGPGTESLTVHPIWSVLNKYLSDLSITIGSYTGYESTSTTTLLYEEANDCKKLLKYDQEEVNNCLCTYFPATAAADGINCDNYTPIYWYHPDYLGNTEFVTDILGRPYQHFFYSPFGEELVEQEPYYGNYDSPYHFNAKEVDPETGFHYYGARYYNSNLSVWLSVDPLADDMPSWSPYAFSFNNPLTYIDPDGRKPDHYFSVQGVYLGSDGIGNNVRIHHTAKTRLQFQQWLRSGGIGSRSSDSRIVNFVQRHPSSLPFNLAPGLSNGEGTQLMIFNPDKALVYYREPSQKTKFASDLENVSLRGPNVLPNGTIFYSDPADEATNEIAIGSLHYHRNKPTVTMGEDSTPDGVSDEVGAFLGKLTVHALSPDMTNVSSVDKNGRTDLRINPNINLLKKELINWGESQYQE